MKLVRTVALVAILGVVAPACSVKDPITPWQCDITIRQDPGQPLQVIPDVIEVDAAFGFINVNNETIEEIGFTIDPLAVFEKVRPRAQRRVRVDEARNGETYVIEDFLHKPDGSPRPQGKRDLPRRKFGEMRVKFVAEQERGGGCVTGGPGINPGGTETPEEGGGPTGEQGGTQTPPEGGAEATFSIEPTP